MPEPGAVDLDGEARLRGCRVDLGPYETDVSQVQGDFDGNARVNLADFGYFQLCFEAVSSNPDWADTCLCVFDFDEDSNVDLDDFAAFTVRLTRTIP